MAGPPPVDTPVALYLSEDSLLLGLGDVAANPGLLCHANWTVSLTPAPADAPATDHFANYMTWVAACITPEAGGRSTDFYHKILEYQKTCRGGRDNVYLFVTGRCVSKGGTPRGVFTLRAYFGENGRRALRENHLESVETLRFHFDNYDDLPPEKILCVLATCGTPEGEYDPLGGACIMRIEL